MSNHEMDANIVKKHFKHWREIEERLDGQLRPILDAREKFEKSLHPSVELHNAYKSSVEDFLERQKKLQKVFKDTTLKNYQLPDFSFHARQIEAYKKSLRSIINPAFEEMHRSFRTLPPRLQDALLLLAKHGWYFDSNMSLSALWRLKNAILEAKLPDVEDALVEYYEEQLEIIEKTISTKFPNRAHIICSALKAHLNGEYYLSIPVLLAQTDGICKEVIGQYLFMKKDKKPRTSIYVEQIATDTFRAALLSPLAVSMPIAASEYERGKDFNLLNRHMVLHGESLDYGNKVNSLKVISLINYVSQSLKRDAEDH